LFALILIFFGCWLPADWLLNRPLSRLDYERIRLGMSLDEVADILDQGTTGDFFLLPDVRPWKIHAEQVPDSLRKLSTYRVLSTDTLRLLIYFDSQDRVIGKSYEASTKPSLPLRVYYALPSWSFLLAAVVGLLVLVSLYFTRPMKSRRHAQAQTTPIPILTSRSQAESRRNARWFLRPFELLTLGRLLMFLMAFGLLFFGCWLVADWLWNRPVNRLNYERIQIGMPVIQAENIMYQMGMPLTQAENNMDQKGGTGQEGVPRGSTARQPTRDPKVANWLEGTPLFHISRKHIFSERVFSYSPQTEGESIAKGNVASRNTLHKAWTNDTHRIDVIYDPQGIVIGKEFTCSPDVTGTRRVFDMLPLWSILLMAAIGLQMMIIHIGYMWWKKSRRRLQTDSPSGTIPAF
jgi:hypothetical protein